MTIHWMVWFVLTLIHWIVMYPVDSVIQLLNNRGQPSFVSFSLKESMAEAMERYPDSCAVLVRRHGVYVWGQTWQKAKAM